MRREAPEGHRHRHRRRKILLAATLAERMLEDVRLAASEYPDALDDGESLIDLTTEKLQRL